MKQLLEEVEMVTVDEEMDVDNNNVIGNLPMDDKNMSRTERDRKIEELLCKLDDDIFCQDLIIPAYIRDSNRYRQRRNILKSNLCKQYLEGKSVEQLLNEHSNIP